MPWQIIAALIGKFTCGGIMYFIIGCFKKLCAWSTEPDYSPSNKCGDGWVFYKKPFFSAAIILFAMSMDIIPYLYMAKKQNVKNPIPLDLVKKIAIPASLNALAFILQMCGLMFIEPYLVLLMKGTRVAFSAVLVMLLLKRKQYAYNWVGVALALTGVALAGVGGALNDPKGSKNLVLGMFLCILSEFTRAVMVVVEEKLLKTAHCDPILMVGLEGIIGTTIMAVVLPVLHGIPGGNEGKVENLVGTFHGLFESQFIWLLALLVIPIVAATYVFGALVTKHLSAVHNALIAVCMNALVWILEIISNAIWKQLGSPFQQYSPIQIVGFVFIVLAMLIYDGQIKLPQLYYPEGAGKHSVGHGHGQEKATSEDDGDKQTIKGAATSIFGGANSQFETPVNTVAEPSKRF